MNPLAGRRWKMQRTVVNISVAVIADYARRKKELAVMKQDDPLAESYRRLNGSVDSAFSSVEIALRSILFDDIADGRGYGRSRAQNIVSKPTYYLRRERVIHDVAVGLGIYR